MSSNHSEPENAEDELQNWIDYEKEIAGEVQDELDSIDPLKTQVQIHSWYSHSAGRGRKRKNPRQVVLIKYDLRPFTSYHLFPFDEYAAELYPEYPPSAVELYFRDQVDELIRQL